MVENCRSRPSSAMEAHAPSRIGQETFQSAVTGWRVWRWLARRHEHMTWVVDTAIHRAVTTWAAWWTAAFEPPRWSLVRKMAAQVQDADGLQTCDGLTTAECSRCCRGCVWPCRRWTGRTSRLAERTERRRTRPSVCGAAASMLFSRWHGCHPMLRRVVPWCDRIVTWWCFPVQPNKLIDRPQLNLFTLCIMLHLKDTICRIWNRPLYRVAMPTCTGLRHCCNSSSLNHWRYCNFKFSIMVVCHLGCCKKFKFLCALAVQSGPGVILPRPHPLGAYGAST